MFFKVLIDLGSLASIAVDLELVKVGLEHAVEVLVQSWTQIGPATRAILVVKRSNALLAEDYVALRTFCRVTNDHQTYLALEFLVLFVADYQRWVKLFHTFNLVLSLDKSKLYVFSRFLHLF